MNYQNIILKLLDFEKIKQSYHCHTKIHELWIKFIIQLNEEKTISKKKYNILKRILDVFIIYFTKHQLFLTKEFENKEILKIFEKDIKILLEKGNSINDFKNNSQNQKSIINQGTIGLLIDYYGKKINLYEIQYLLNYIKLKGEPKKKIINKVINSMYLCNNLIKSSMENIKYLNEEILSNEIIFHSLNSQMNLAHNLYSFTDEDLNIYIKVHLDHNHICNLGIKKNIIDFVKDLLSTSYWFSHIYKKNIIEEKISIKNTIITDYDIKIMEIPIKNRFIIKEKCKNCNNDVLCNIIPGKFKSQIKTYLFNNLSGKQYKYLNNLKKELLIKKSNDKINIQNEKPIIIFDGANIGYFNNNQKELDFERINLVINHSNFNNIIKYIILNERHRYTIPNKYKENFNKDDFINIIFSPKGLDDDLISLYIWLSKSNSYLVTNDKFTIHKHKIQDNLYLKKSWTYMEYYQKKNYQIINNKAIIKDIMIDNILELKHKLHKEKSNIFNEIETFKNNFIINYDIKPTHIHFPICDSDNNSGKKKKILYGCKKIS